MVKNIIVGALTGAAIAWLIVEKKNHKSMQKTYHQLGDYFLKVKKNVMSGLEKGKYQAEQMGDRTAKMVNEYRKN